MVTMGSPKEELPEKVPQGPSSITASPFHVRLPAAHKLLPAPGLSPHLPREEKRLGLAP